MVERARAEAQNHWFTYNEQMSVESVAQAVSNLAIQFSGDYDSKEPAMVKYKQLYNLDNYLLLALLIFVIPHLFSESSIRCCNYVCRH